MAPQFSYVLCNHQCRCYMMTHYWPTVANYPVGTIQLDRELMIQRMQYTARLRCGYEVGSLEVKVRPNAGDQPNVENKLLAFRGVYANSADVTENEKGFRQSLATARKQILNGPGCLCLSIPHHHEIPADERVERAASSLQEALSRDTSRINAVVLTCSIPHPNPAQSGRADQLITVATMVFNESPEIEVDRKQLAMLGPSELIMVDGATIGAF